MILLLLTTLMHANKPPATFINGGSPRGVPLASDCKVRELAWVYGLSIAPEYRASVGMKSLCNMTMNVTRPTLDDAWTPPIKNPALPTDAIYVSTSGSDGAAGTKAAPLLTIAAGVAKATEIKTGQMRDRSTSTSESPSGGGGDGGGGGGGGTVVLREGTYYLPAPIVLTAKHSGLTITNYPSERAVVSGGILLNVSWSTSSSASGNEMDDDTAAGESGGATAPTTTATVNEGGTPEFDIYNDSDAVFGRAKSRASSGDTIFLGLFNDYASCNKAAINSNHNPGVTGWTWSPPNAGAFAHNCHGIIDNAWTPHTLPGFVSGRRHNDPPSPPPPTPSPSPSPPTPRVAHLTGKLVGPHTSSVFAMPGLRINGYRAISARYPNIKAAETHNAFNPIDGWIQAKTAWSPPLAPKSPAIEIQIGAADWPAVDWPMNESIGVPLGESGAGGQGYFHLGVGGPCDGDVMPAYGYMCALKGGPRGAGQHMHPAGLHYTEALLPNLPYKNATGAVVHAWRPAHWYTVQFEVGAATPSTTASTPPPPSSSGMDKGLIADAGTSTGTDGLFSFARGGFQGGEGFPSGAEWWIQGVREELDSPLEYYYDAELQELLFVPNATTAPLSAAAAADANRAGFEGSSGIPMPPEPPIPPAGTEFVATNLKVLFNVQGTADSIVRDVTFRGLVFRDTAQTYLDDHGLPSAGDWALQYTAALTANNTDNLRVERSLFTRLDGLAIGVYGHNYNTTIDRNEFEWLGGSAVALWGRTSAWLNANRSQALPWSDHPNGPDGTALDVPLDVTVSNNVAHDLGIWQKQSSLLFQAVSARTNATANIAYNLPRAAINLNDGHGGGDTISRNLLLNTCRESGDHGPINSWDRLPYITPIKNGQPSIVPETRHLHHNFIIGNYNSQEAIDNDDGSARYLTEHNVLAYAQYGMKSDYGGWQNNHHANIYPYVCSCYGEGANDSYTNNSCIVHDGGGCYFWPAYASDCDSRSGGPPPPGFHVEGNGVYTSSGNVSVCEQKGKPGGNQSLAQWVSKGHDQGSFAAKWPSDSKLESWIRALLSF